MMPATDGCFGSRAAMLSRRGGSSTTDADPSVTPSRTTCSSRSVSRLIMSSAASSTTSRKRFGNLMNNVCKWARCRIAATSQREDGRLTIALEDDGPGLPAAHHGYAPRQPWTVVLECDGQAAILAL